MSRARTTRVLLTTATFLIAAAALSSWALLSPGEPARNQATGSAVIRNQDSSVYIEPSGILFDVGSATLRSEAVPTLRAIVADVRKTHLRGTLRVDGSTDAVGSDDDNLDLSRYRADTVATWLVEEAAVDRSRILVIAHGEGSPVQPNDTEDQRRANRRVVITVAR
jgi:outer membrane protein OmpA-like peptidoglycan-associated protein